MSQFIFLDESGDLGFSPQKSNSQYFIITVLFVKDKKPFEKIVKKVHAGLRKHVKRIGGGVLHAVKEKPATRKRVLTLTSTVDCSVMTIYLNKSKVYSNLQDEKHVLYNYVVNILLDRIMTRKYLDTSKPINLIAAKRETNRFLNDNFSNYLRKQVKQNHNVDLTVDIKYPSQEKSLQVVDFICWSVFRKYEFKDSEYYNLVKKVIREERGLF